MATTSRRKPQARPAPRPAPDHGHDPAGPAATEDTPTSAPEPASSRTTSTRGSSRSTASRSRKTAPAADEATRFPARITLPLTEEADLALKQARLHDKVPAVGRIRAMIDLWQTNERFRAQVDRHAHNTR